jgi:hypothetical protein
MNQLLFILITFFVFQSDFSRSDSQERVLGGYDPKVDIISDKYEAGEFLIYDCEDQHWTCVRESFFKDCQSIREEDSLNKKVFSRCAPVGEFPTKKSCFQRQLFMVSHNHGASFCHLGEWQAKEILLR